METLKKEYFIGGSKDLHNIFTMELSIRNWNGYPEFTASFNEGELVNIDEKNEDDASRYADEMDQLDVYYIEENEDGSTDGVIRQDIAFTECYI